MDDELLSASAKYFRTGDERTPAVEHIAAFYRERQMAAVVFTVDATTATGHPALSSEEIADRAAGHADVLIPFGSVDPLVPDGAVRRARRLVAEHGVRAGSSSTRACGVHAQRSRRVPAVRGDRGTGRPGGLPHRPDWHRSRAAGGRGIKLRLSDPMLITTSRLTSRG